MNARTTKLLHHYARETGKTMKEVKREWHNTPRNKRGEVRSTMQSGLWSSELRDWRNSHKPPMYQKNAAEKLNVPEDTYRGWESMRSTPPNHVIIALRQTMKANP